MPYYHIKMTHGASNVKDNDYELNLSEEETRAVAEQYENKDFVLFDGKWVKVIDIWKIEIREEHRKEQINISPAIMRSSILTKAPSSRMLQENSSNHHQKYRPLQIMREQNNH